MDRRGRFLSKAGQSSGVLGAAIPSRDARERDRWRVEDGRGVILAPSQYPTEKALRGEIDCAGAMGLYQNQGEHLFRVTSVPSAAIEDDEVAAVTFVQLADPEGLKAGRGVLEHSLVDMLAKALVTQWRQLAPIDTQKPRPN